MALTKEQKKAQLTELTRKFQDAQSVMFAHYTGLSVAEVSALRRKLKQEEAEMKVAKKTLMQLAVREAGLPEITPDDLEGPVSCIFSFGDPLSGAQTAYTFGKEHKQVELIGGVYEGRFLSAAQATEMAQIPGREQLLATFASMLRSPLMQFAMMCNSPLSGFARGVKQLAEQGGTGTAESAPQEEAPKEETEPTEDESSSTKETDTAASQEEEEAPKQDETESSQENSPESSVSPESSQEEDAQSTS